MNPAESQSARERLRALLHGKAKAAPALPSITPRTCGDELPLSFAQEKIWAFEQANPGHRSYQMFHAYRVHGILDRDALTQALVRLVGRHEILRTRIVDGSDGPRQRVEAETAVVLGFEDLSGGDATRRPALVEALIDRAMCRLPDIAAGPVFEAGLIRLAEDRHVLTLNCHHLAADATSMQLLTRELAVHYSAALRGQPSPLPALPLQFGDYACWQREHLTGQELVRQRDYWLAQLQGLETFSELPLDRVRPAEGPRDASRVHVQLDPELWGRVTALARDLRCSTYTVMLAATHLFIYAATGEARQLIGVISSKKPDDGLAWTLGDFHNVSPMHVAFEPGLSFAEWVAAVRVRTLGAVANQDLPFGMLTEALGWPGDRQLPRLLYAHINAPEAAPTDAALAIVPIPLEEGYMTRNDLRINCHEQTDRATMIWHYAKDLFERPSVRAFADRHRRLLAAAVAAPVRPLEQLLGPASDEAMAASPYAAASASTRL